MATPSAAALLRLWEQGQGAAPPERALLLLAAAEPGRAWEALGDLPLGARDGRILRLREGLFGRALTALADCPHCAARVEVALDTEALHTPEPAQIEFETERHGIRLRFRLPNGHDLVACAACGEVDAAERQLLARCLLEAVREGRPLPPSELPPSAVAHVMNGMAAADPGADVELELRCPACRESWETGLDIAAYLWVELQDWALRILREVHQLAAAYGWPESEILALSPLRRRLYLEMAAS